MSELAKTSRPAAAGLGRLVGAFRCSVAGLRYAARNEAAFRQELIVSALLLVPALALPVARFERLVLILSMLLVMVVGSTRRSRRPSTASAPSAIRGPVWPRTSAAPRSRSRS